MHCSEIKIYIIHARLFFQRSHSSVCYTEKNECLILFEKG